MSLIIKTSKVVRLGMLAIQAAAIVLALYEAYKKTQKSWNPKFSDADLRNKFARGKRDIIDEMSWESFPASDPPASNKFT